MALHPPVPYIGITGIVTPDDLDTVKACVERLKAECPTVPGGDPTHRFMAGVLVSKKTLNSLPTTNRRYPKFEVVNDLLDACLGHGAWPVVHYNTQAKGADLLAEMNRLRELLPAMRGLQLNVVCPDPDAVREFTTPQTGVRDVEVILQVNNTSLVKSATPPARKAFLLDYVETYVSRGADISHVLIDASGGNGRIFDHRGTVDTISDAFFHIQDHGVRLGLAGGLGPECAESLGDIQYELLGQEDDPDILLTDISFDAESRVRVPVPDPIEGEKYQDTLDREKALAYVTAVCSIIKKEHRSE